MGPNVPFVWHIEARANRALADWAPENFGCGKLGPRKFLVANWAPANWAPVDWAPWRQIGPQQIGPRQIGPLENVGAANWAPGKLGP